MKKIYLYMLFLAVVVVSSCSKKLDLQPVSSISDSKFWKTPEQFDAFVSGVHIAFRNNTNSFEYLGELRADVFGTDPGSNSVFTGEATEGAENLWRNTLNMDNPGVADFGGFYFNINQLNLLIQKLNSTEIISNSNKGYFMGVAHGMRAFYYFHLLRSWGKSVIQTDPTIALDISKLSKAASEEKDVMALIKDDISKSESSFGTDYTFRNQKGYWSKAATLMLKADVYLWTGHREGGKADALIAKNALSEIQSNIPGLSLLPSFENVFSSNNKGNNEIIFAVRNKLNESTLPFANRFFPQTSFIANFYDSANARKFDIVNDNWGGLLRVPVKIATFQQFNDADTRKFASIQAAYNKEGNTYKIAGAFASKYKGEQNAGKREFTNDYPIYRYADLLLLMAESKIILEEDPTNEINLVRSRAYGSNYNTSVHGFPSQSIDANPKAAILQERFFEFLFEGKRWYDLRRMGDSYVYNFTNISSAESYKLLWPIDRNTLTNNRDLNQTQGYPAF